MTPDEERLIAVGLITANHVWLEEGLRRLFSTLAPGAAGLVLAGTTVSKLSSQCRLLLVGVADDDLRKGIEVVLSTVDSVNADRNRLVHDLWFATDEDERWMLRGVSGNRPEKPVTLESLNTLLERMRRLHHQVAAASWLGMDARLWPTDSGLPSRDYWLALLRGEFDLNEAGGARPRTTQG